LFLRFLLNLRPIRWLRHRFQSTSTLAQDAVKAGAEVRLDIVLTNVSAEKIVIAECVEPNYQFEVYDNEGKPLPRLRDCVPNPAEPEPKTGSWTFSKTPLNQHKHVVESPPTKNVLPETAKICA
jgi:hypothetical protein